jgi:hypothetical protein
MGNRTRSSRRRRRSRDGLLVQVLVPVGLLIVVVMTAVLVLRPVVSPPIATPTVPACPKVPAVVVGDIRVPAGPVVGFCQGQLIDAVEIMRAADAYSPDIRAKQIGVMTAIGESSLRNLSYGDVVGPDSRGIFQQRSNWGTLAERMDPYTAAFNFYHRMFGVAGWNTLPPTQVAHTVQRNADPDYYSKYFSRATRLVDALLARQLPPPPSAVPVS